MYQRLPRSHDNVMGYEVSGAVTEDDYLEMVTELREVIDDYGGVRVLVRAPELPSPDFPRAFSDRIEPLTDELGAVEAVRPGQRRPGGGGGGRRGGGESPHRSPGLRLQP